MLRRLTCRWVVTGAVALAALLACAQPSIGAPASESTTLAPHIATSYDTDVCAMCHRAHSASGTGVWTSAVASDVSGSALLVGTATDGDVGLCYSCHGVDSLGSAIDVQSSFEASSGHSLDPTASAFGPSPKHCSTCHDSHGTARDASNTPYPGLLRAITATGVAVYRGNEYCGTCHTEQPGSSFHGLGVFNQTAHAAKIVPPATGTAIVCDACHDPHGSSVAPTIRTMMETPSVSVATTISANDRTFCFACHDGSTATWTGSATYRAAHASSNATVAIPGTWAPAGSSRRVGECQVCHNPTGSADASGVVIPSQLAEEQPALCYGCHDASGPAASDLATLAYSPTTPGNEVLGLVPAAVESAAYGRLQVYSRESSAASTPVGPRDLDPVTEPGGLGIGDIDGDGVREALVTDAVSTRLAVVSSDSLKGVATRLLSIPLPAVPAALVSVGDVFVDGSGLPEIVTVSAGGDVDVLRYSGGSLVRIASATVGGTPSGLATGDVTGTAGADIAVVTSNGLYILTENGAALTTTGPFGTGSQPSGVAIGDAWNGGGNEVVVSYAGEATDVLTVFDGAGAVRGSGGGALAAGSARGVTVGDIFTGVTPSGTSGAEMIVAYGGGSGGSGVRVIEQAVGGGFGTSFDYSTGAGSNATGLALGDANGDGERDLAVATAGDFTRTTAGVAPAIRVFEQSATHDDLVAGFTLTAGGVEMAGGRPAVVVGDIGAVGPSRHADGAVAHAHEPTESVPSPRHVECSDCHDSHLASSAASSTAALPGALIGARGVLVTNVDSATVNLSGPTTATADYMVCFKCHSRWDPEAPRSIASEVNTRGASFHPVEGPAPATNATGTTLVGGVSVGDKTACNACHGTSLAGAVDGPHTSPDAPLLKSAYFGTAVDDASLLCYDCHRSTVYLTGADDNPAGGTGSGFYNAGATAPKKALHSYHSSMGFGCDSCHVSHGSSDLPYLLRATGFAWSDPAGAVDGECSTACHAGGATHGYTR